MMISLGILLLCSAIVSASFSNHDIHNYMTPEELQKVFHTNSVPKYEIVNVNLTKRLHKRITSKDIRMFIRVFSKDINLWLHPRDTNLAGEDTPVYFANYSSSNPHGVEYTLQDGLMEQVGIILEDPEMQASFVIGKEQDSRCPKVDGYIASKNIAVRSLPTRVLEEYRRRRRSVGKSEKYVTLDNSDHSEDLDDLDSPCHIAFESANPYEESLPTIPVNMTEIREITSRSVLEIPDMLYPEILSVVEYTMYSPYEDDLISLLEYLLAFWNGVDLKYRSLTSPGVRFHISAIVLSIDPRATPYISDNSLGEDTFNSTAAMTSTSQFYYAVQDTFPLDDYDIAVTITMQQFGFGDESKVVGKSFVGGACFHTDKDQTTLNIVIVRDNGAFDGIILAAHELGHQFGSRHDLYEGDCVTESGFLMSYTPWYTKNSSDFSPCSVLAFNIYLNKSQLECLYNKPEYPDRPMPKLMPGRVKNMEEQCQAMGYLTTCVIKQTNSFLDSLKNFFISRPRLVFDVCLNILCVDNTGHCVRSGTAAVDGTTCGKNGEFCLHMQCVSL